MFQSIQACRPEPAIGRQPVVELGQWFRADPVQPALGVHASLDHSCLLEHAKMLRHRRLAQVELPHEVSDRPLPLPEQLEDGLSAGLAQGVERGDRSHVRVYRISYITVNTCKVDAKISATVVARATTGCECQSSPP